MIICVDFLFLVFGKISFVVNDLIKKNYKVILKEIYEVSVNVIYYYNIV